MKTPVTVTTQELQHTVSFWGRSVTLGANSLPVSIMSQGKELLAAPMRLVGIEDGEPMVWDTEYQTNESEAFIQSRSEDSAVICGALATNRFIVDTVFSFAEDGLMTIQMKLMPRGRTVAQVFGLAGVKPTNYSIDRLWLEIPLRKEFASHFSMCPNSQLYLADGTVREMNEMSTGGAVPQPDTAMPFKSLLFLNCEDRGLGWFAESDRNWQPADVNRAIELVHKDDAVVVRLHLLDSQPTSWKGDPTKGQYAFAPVSYMFGLQATPVKPFPQMPYVHNALHLDCFIKVKGNYMDFMAQENRYDRLVEKGVTTLILHEKWNKSQNWFELSEFTRRQVCTIVNECHKRGIRVLTYFGYEISAMAPIWNELSEDVHYSSNHNYPGGWYRVPYQRDYIVCYNSEYQDRFINGIANIMDTCHTDGVYLDGTADLRPCDNTRHGCGSVDEAGTVHCTFPVLAVRRLFQRLSKVVHDRGGMINVHSFGCINFTALPFIDLSWYGENMQFKYIKGQFDAMPLDYFRSEYLGRNIGVPVEFIAYENRPIWTFENAVAMASIHGIMPRPNDIEHPLDVMSPIWKILNRFPIAQSDWCPYWNNAATASQEQIKVSYYRYADVAGKVSLLAFVANTAHDALPSYSVEFAEGKGRQMVLNASSDGDGLEGYGYKILYVTID